MSLASLTLENTPPKPRNKKKDLQQQIDDVRDQFERLAAIVDVIVTALGASERDLELMEMEKTKKSEDKPATEDADHNDKLPTTGNADDG